MEIRRDKWKRLLFLNQKNNLLKVLNIFNMIDSKVVQGSTAPHFKLSISLSPQTEEERCEMHKIHYASVVGSIIYAMICTRPGLAYAVSLVGRFMATSDKEHWQGMKWILRYVKGTLDLGLCFDGIKTRDEMVRGYTDPDFAVSVDTKRSLTSYVFTLYGTAINWKSILQHV